MKSTVVFERDEGYDFVSGKITDKEFGTSIIHPFKSTEFKSIKNKLGYSELLLDNGLVEEIEVDSIVEWSDSYEVHIFGILFDEDLLVITSSENNRMSRRIAPLETFSVLIYADPGSAVSASVEFKFENGEWKTTVHGKDNYRFRDHNTTFDYHFSFGSHTRFDDVTGIAEV